MDQQCFGPIWEVSLFTLASVETLHIPLFIATEHPTCGALVALPSATYTFVLKQQVGVVTEVKQLFFQFDSTTGVLLFHQSPGWQTHSLKPSNWLLRGNMLPCGY